MAHRRESPEEFPAIRAPPRISGNPPRRPPPRAVHWEDIPPRGFPPGGESPPYRYGDDAGRRFRGESPPQRYIEGPPPGYQDSPPRRFPGRRNPPPRYLSPEDSPPYRYIEDAPRRRGGPHRPYSEDAALPVDIDGPPPPGFRDEGRRRFGGSPSTGASSSGYRDGRLHLRPGSESPSPPPGFRDEGRRLGGGNLSAGFPSYRDERHAFDSESPSPPPGYFPPPPPPPHGRYRDEPPRRFGASPEQFTSHGDDESPPPYAADPTRRTGAPPRHHFDGSPPGPAYADEPPRRFAGTPPREFHGGSPPGHPHEPPRRFASPQRFADDSPPSPKGPRGFAEHPARRFSTTPPRRADAPPPGPPPRPPPEPAMRQFRDGSPPRRQFRDGSPPRRQFRDGSPPRPPGYAEDPPPRPNADAPPRQFPDSSPPGRPGSSGHPEGPRPGRFGDPPRPHGDALPRQFPDGSPPSRPGSSGPPESPRPVRFGALHREFPDGARVGAPGHVEDPPTKISNISPPRPGPIGSPPGYDTPPGYESSPGYDTAGLGYETPSSGRGYDTPSSGRGYDTPAANTPPHQFSDGSPGYQSTPPRRLDGPLPLGAPVGALPPIGRSRLTPERHAGGSTQPHFPPDTVAAAALTGRPSSSSTEASPPGPPPVRYTGREPLPPLRTPEESPPDIYGGPRPSLPLGSSPPRYRGSRYEPRPDGYGGPPAYVTPPREPYRLPPPGLGHGGDAPLLPPGFVTPQRFPPGADGASPEFLFAGLPRRHPDGYTATTPPRQPPSRPPGLGHDAIFTADVVPIELDDKLKDIQPHQGNPGSSTGGGWKDLWAALVFILHLAAIAALSVIFGLQGLTNTIQKFNTPNSFHITDWFPQLAAAAIVGAAFACTWQYAIRMAPVLMILITIWTGSAVMILVGIVLIATGRSTGLIGLLFLFAGLCQALYAFVVRDRIPFAGEMLKKVIAVCNAYPSTYAVSYGVVLVSLGWLALWIFGLSGSGIRPRHVAIMTGFIASLMWTMQVLRNIVRVTVAGTVTLFYFQQRNMPRMPTYVSLVRACTTSLGSICFGSFFVPLVEAPCHSLRRVNSQAGASEFLFSCVVCLLACFERLIRYFNRMGYIQVAVYGKPFVRASKDTWDMLQAQAVDVLVHDDLTSTVLFLSCGLGGSLSALVGGIWTFIVHKSLTTVICLISYLIGALMTYVTMAVLESGVATYYVCFAEDPASLQRHDGPFYERMWVRQMELQSPATELTA